VEDDLKIKCNNEVTRSLGLNGEIAHFDEKGIATVSKELGEALAAAYPDYVEVVKEKATRKSNKE
jgi:hypothetical protein